MSIFGAKERNLNELIDKLNALTSTYSQSSYEAEKIKTEKNELLRQKSDIEKKNHELMREHKYLKEKVANLQEEVNKNSIVEEGKCFQSYYLENEDQIDIISVKNSVFGYLAIQGGFKIDKVWGSYSINTKAKIGPNNGEKFSAGEKIYINKPEVNNFVKRKVEFKTSLATTIRTTKGTNFDYFSQEAVNKFFTEEYKVTKLSDRMGMRLEGPKLENTVNTNIKSEGLVKGVIQVPADGNPIIMFSDHGSIGGYPKIAVVITADHDKAAQLTPGSKIKFKEVNLDEAESLFKTSDSDEKN